MRWKLGDLVWCLTHAVREGVSEKVNLELGTKDGKELTKLRVGEKAFQADGA